MSIEPINPPPPPSPPPPPRAMSWHPAPAPGATARMPAPPTIEAARADAERVGKAYGKFRADLDINFFVMFETPFTGGVALWDILNPEERRQHLSRVQAEAAKLPPLPTATSLPMLKAVHEGFLAGSRTSYAVARINFGAVWVACELAKLVVLEKAATPNVIAIGNAFTSRFRDCAAQTAARIIRDATGAEAEAAFLVRSFGLPRLSIDDFERALNYALNWFEGVGIRLAPRSGGFYRGGVQGRYAVFFKGGTVGGHVVFGEVTPTGLRIVDHQIGREWDNLMSAERALGMQANKAYRVESVTIPGGIPPPPKIATE